MNVFLQNSQPKFHFPCTEGSQQLVLRNRLNLWLNERAVCLMTIHLPKQPILQLCHSHSSVRRFPFSETDFPLKRFIWKCERQFDSNTERTRGKYFQAWKWSRTARSIRRWELRRWSLLLQLREFMCLCACVCVCVCARACVYLHCFRPVI